MLLENAYEQAVKKANKNIFDFLSDIYFFLKKENDCQLLRRFAEEYYDKFNDDKKTEPSILSREVLGVYLKKYRTLVDGYIDYLISEDLQEDLFYQHLWDFIHNTTFFHNENESMIAFILIFWNPLIPYFYFPVGVRMENEEFRECLKKLDQQQHKLYFILQRNYLQKTERASVLLSVLDEVADVKRRSVLLARLLDWVVEDKKQDEE